MKRWQCTVCKYIHEGDEPPEKCPVCGVGPEKFVLLNDTSDSEDSENHNAEVSGATSTKSSEGPREWVCSVCNYVHSGESPPDVCPICGVKKEKFQPKARDSHRSDPWPADGKKNEKSSLSASPDPEDPVADGFLTRQILQHHLHPMSVHVPNGVIPVAVVFVFLAVFFQVYNLAEAAFYNLVAVLLSMPLVWISGVVEWKKRYAGALTWRFVAKIVCGIIVTGCALTLAGWYVFAPDALRASSSASAIILALYLVMLVATALAGFIGGKFVFKD